ncbi:MAG: endonuclease III [Bacteroidetes bacterium]|nr:MAG: endonuclease III [Bacteroidota bacterium]
MTIKERYNSVIDYFLTHAQDAKTELNHTNPFELLVAVVLSAQCTDKRVNMHTPLIFKDFPTPESLANTDIETLFPYIKSISFPNNKTKNLIKLGQVLVKDFNSTVPSAIEDLVKIPGVGRKTANVIASVIFKQPAMAVDTHVFRVSKRLGLVAANLKTPLEVEKILVKNIPKKHIADAHHWLILHGRYICIARTPKCSECGLTTICKYFESVQNGKPMKIVSIK